MFVHLFAIHGAPSVLPRAVLRREVFFNILYLGIGWSGNRIPVGCEIFRTCPNRPWGPPSLLYNGYRDFPGGKERPGRDTDPSPPSSAVVVKE